MIDIDNFSSARKKSTELKRYCRIEVWLKFQIGIVCFIYYIKWKRIIKNKRLVILDKVMYINVLKILLQLQNKWNRGISIKGKKDREKIDFSL